MGTGRGQRRVDDLVPSATEGTNTAATTSTPMSRWSLIGWVIVGIATVYYLAYSFLLLPPALYPSSSLVPLARNPFAPALILAAGLTITGIIILVAKLITGVRDRDAGRVLGVAVGWALLIGIPSTYQGPWMLLAAAGVAGVAGLIHLTNRSR